MSMTLLLWKAPVVREANEAEALLERWYERGDESAFEPSEDVNRVLEEIRRRYPDDPDAGADDSAPWSSWPIQDSDRLIDLSIRWSADNAVLDYICELAREHRLVLYDPQGPDVHLPDDPIESDPIPPPTASDYIKALLMVVPFAAATYAAWLIPWGWLRWPLVAVALFLTAAALFVVYAMVAGALGWLNEKPSS